MRYFFLLPLLLIGQLAFAQLDTLYMGIEKIPCKVEEATTDGIRFRKPQEDFSRTCYQQVVDSIRFSGGKVEVFRSLGQDIEGSAQYNSIPITTIPAAVAGMSLISNVSTSDESYLYLPAVEHGAQVIFIHYGDTHGTGGNVSTRITASLYRRQPINREQVRRLLDGRSRLQVDQQIRLRIPKLRPSKVQLLADIGHIREENGQVLAETIITNANGEQVFDGSHALRVTYLNKKYLELYSPQRNIIYRLLLKKEELSAHPVRGVDDANMVSMTEVAADVQQLVRLGEVSAKIKIPTVGAYTNLKAKAAMMGGNVLCLDAMDHTPASALHATVYTSRLPAFADFQTTIGQKRSFYGDQLCQVQDSLAEVDVQIKRLDLHIDSLYEEGGLIFVKGKLQDFKDVQTFRVSTFNQDGFYLYFSDKGATYSCRILLDTGSI